MRCFSTFDMIKNLRERMERKKTGYLVDILKKKLRK